MQDWFDIQRIDNDTFVISEYRHWEETHCYLLCGRERAVLIDTGLGVGDIGAVVDSLTKLPVTVVSTHVHWDHIGGHGHFQDIAVHEAEAEWLSGGFPLPPAAVRSQLTGQPCDFPPGFSVDDYRVFQGAPRTLLHDGDRLELGGRTLCVIHTPGHSPGHCCYYDLPRQYLYTGDLVYKGCLDMFYPTTDPGLFYRSVQRIRPYAVRRLLPGHHGMDIPLSLPAEIEAAFARLEREGKLRQGAGLFDFGSFQLHL